LIEFMQIADASSAIREVLIFRTPNWSLFGFLLQKNKY